MHFPIGKVSIYSFLNPLYFNLCAIARMQAVLELYLGEPVNPFWNIGSETVQMDTSTRINGCIFTLL